MLELLEGQTVEGRETSVATSMQTKVGQEVMDHRHRNDESNGLQCADALESDAHHGAIEQHRTPAISYKQKKRRTKAEKRKRRKK
jgi:hypothetical protein